MIGDGEILASGLVAEGAGEPALADTGRPHQQEIVKLADEVAAGELEEEVAVETARGAEVDILDLGVMAQPGGAGTGLETLLTAGRHLAFDDFRRLLTALFLMLACTCIGFRCASAVREINFSPVHGVEPSAVDRVPIHEHVHGRVDVRADLPRRRRPSNVPYLQTRPPTRAQFHEMPKHHQRIGLAQNALVHG